MEELAEPVKVLDRQRLQQPVADLECMDSLRSRADTEDGSGRSSGEKVEKDENKYRHPKEDRCSLQDASNEVGSQNLAASG